MLTFLLSLACRITNIHLTLDNLRQCFGPRECWWCGEPWWQPSLLSLCCLLHVFVSSQSPTVYLGLLVCGLTLQCVDLDVGKLKSSGCSAGWGLFLPPPPPTAPSLRPSVCHTVVQNQMVGVQREDTGTQANTWLQFTSTIQISSTGLNIIPV